MKNLLLILVSLWSVVVKSQNIQKLFDELPMAYSTCNETFQSAEIEWESMTLDNDSIFKRAKSWAPGGELKAYSIKLDKLNSYIERASENNSFSLSAPPSIDKEIMSSIEQLVKVRESITSTWNSNREGIININSNFIVPNELDNGCDQIEFAINVLNVSSTKLNDQLNLFKSKINSQLIDFQTRYDELNKTKHPMVNNQILDELSNLLLILNEITNVLNFHYKNMVETRMALNNAMCK
jgi:hypothetical protein